MMREFNERMKVIRSCPMKIFLGGKGGQMTRFWYPYKLQKVTQLDGDITDRCMEFMMDSAIGEDEITNREVLEKAIELGAEYVVPKDYLWDQQRTYESILEFNDILEGSDYNGRVLYPLQPSSEGGTDHADMYWDLMESRAATDGKRMFVIGGVKNADPATQIEALENFRVMAPAQSYVHGLGMGGSIEFVRAIREDPGLCDAVDLSTPIQCVNRGEVMTKTGSRAKIGMPKGEDTTTVMAAFANAMMIQLNYLYSPLCTDEEVLGLAERAEDTQSSLIEVMADTK